MAEIKPEIKNFNGIIGFFPSPKAPKISEGLGTAIFRKMHENKHCIAQIDAQNQKTDNWETILTKSIRTAMEMKARGVTKNDIVSICSFNNLDSSIPLFAALFLGVKIANLDPTLSLEDTIHLLLQVSPKMVFVCPEGLKLMEEALREAEIEAEIVLFDDEKNGFLDFLQKADGENDFEPVQTHDFDETAVILFSSGTTGLPKGICMSHYGLLAPFVKNGDKKVLDRQVLLIFSSLYWMSSLTALLSSVFDGVVRLVVPKFEKETVWDLISRNKVNFMFLAPSQTVALLKNGRPADVDLNNLLYVMVGGGPISKDQMLEFRKCFSDSFVANVYGQTELVSNVLRWSLDADDLNLFLTKPTSIGRPIHGMQYKIVDAGSGMNLGPNKRGELRIKSIFNMRGYYNQDSHNIWDHEGFIKTGDIGYYDEDYCFYIVDRKKAMLKYKSWHVVPAKLEGILLGHPAVEAAVVFGLPHEEDGDHPMGVVVLKGNSRGKISENEIEEYVAQKVGEMQRLRAGVKFVDDIPLTPSGKYKRTHMRDLVLQKKI